MRSKRTYAEQQAVEAAKRHARTARGECAQCGEPSPHFYSCQGCRDRRNARVARNKLFKLRLEQARLARYMRALGIDVGVSS